MATERMRILVVSGVIPWPETSGLSIRLSNVLRGLARLGEIDVFVFPGHDRWHVPVIPPDIMAPRVEVVARPPGDFSLGHRVRWLLSGQLPSHFVGRDYRDAQAKFHNWIRPEYDLAWFSHLKTYIPLAGHVRAPTILDYDDLEDRKILEQLAVSNAGDALPRFHAHRLYYAFTRFQAKKNVRLWATLQRQAARAIEAAVVCSEVDRRYLGLPNVHVIPNGYSFQSQPVGRAESGEPPTIVLPGVFRYPPNIDAARHLVTQIAPLVWVQKPTVQVRLVGPADDRVTRLHDPPRVVVTGFVPDIRTELARADVIAVPIRFGGGTRIKVLEAFAHRIPVVATSKGAEGIDGISGRHLLIADTPEAFARACLRLLTDVPYRRSLADEAHTLFTTKYRWDQVQDLIAALGSQIASGHAERSLSAAQ